MLHEFIQYIPRLALLNVLFFILYITSDFLFIIPKHFINAHEGIKELFRKSVHLSTALIFILATYILPEPIFIFLGIETLIALVCGYFLRLLHIAYRTRENNFGIYFLIIGFILDAFLFWTTQMHAIRIAILILGFSDTAASLIGKFFPYKSYILIKDKKTLSGSLGFYITTLWILSVASLITSTHHTLSGIVIIFLSAFILTGIEALSHKGSDNLTLVLAYPLLYIGLLYQITIVSGIILILILAYAKYYRYNKRSVGNVQKIF